eukprot:45117-Chlamydomonas_euryale.AAC.2
MSSARSPPPSPRRAIQPFQLWCECVRCRLGSFSLDTPTDVTLGAAVVSGDVRVKLDGWMDGWIQCVNVGKIALVAALGADAVPSWPPGWSLLQELCRIISTIPGVDRLWRYAFFFHHVRDHAMFVSSWVDGWISG